MKNQTIPLMKCGAILMTSTLAFVLLIGCGGQNFAVEEGSSNFGQQVKYDTQVDVLWVVDTSGSMSKRQAALAKQIPMFVDGLNATGLDYNIGVTTMDLSPNGAKGKLIAQNGTPLILTKATPNLTAILVARIQAGETGSPVERGREAMLAALRAAAAGGANDGFLRKDALLNVIFLTDEEDKSDNSVDYVKLLDSMKPALPLGDRSWAAHFIGVSPTDPTCKAAEWGESEPGYHYIDLANASGGSSESICDADFRRALSGVRARVLEMSTEFPLDRKPLVSTIKVIVNGVTVPNSETNGWTYRPSGNSIRFHGNAVPPAGAKIQVTFDPEGLK